MAITEITLSSSRRTLPRYEEHRRIYAATTASRPGLQEELREFPLAIVAAMKELLGESRDTPLQLNARLEGFTSTEIQTRAGFFITDDAVYELEALTLTPAVGSHTGVFEISLEPVQDGDTIAADFWDENTTTAFTQLAATKHVYQIRVQENHATTATLPATSSPWIRWIEYERSGPGGPIVDVRQVASPTIHLDADGQLLLEHEPTAAAAAVTRGYVDARAGVRGLIYGGVERSGNNPPSLLPGTYEVDGVYIKFTGAQALSWVIDALGDTAPATGCHYVVTLEADGRKAVHLVYGDAIVNAIPIQAISDAGGGEWNIEMLNAVDLSGIHVGAVAVSYGTTAAGNTGTLVVTAYSNAPDSAAPGRKYVRVKNAGGEIQATAAGTLSVHYRIESEAIPGDADQYAPYFPHDRARNAFYSSFLNLLGRVGRIIGTFFVNDLGVVGRIYSAGNGNEWREFEGVPLGTPLPCFCDHLPAGTLDCAGQAVSRTRYARLFDRIGNMFGDGDGSTTFNLPDLRGEFLRGLDMGRGADPDSGARVNRGDGTAGDAVGTRQTSMFAAHSHGYTHPGDQFQTVPAGSQAYAVVWSPFGPSTGATGGNETRPRNVNVRYVLKY